MDKTLQEHKELQVVNVPIGDLTASEYNPRKWEQADVDQLKKSIGEFGVVDPLIANCAPNRKNILVGGHFRWYVLKEMGFKEVPVVYVKIPDIKREQELNLRLNKNMGKWDYDLLANFDENILLGVGFSTDELDEIFGLEKAEEFDEAKELEKAVKNPRGVKTGDLWQLGDHKLIIGDSTKRENWQKLLGEEKFDFMFTDPPYNLAYSKKRVRKVKTKDGWKLKGERVYDKVGETDNEGRPIREMPKTGFGAKQNRIYEGMELSGGVPEFDEWLSIANDFQNPKGANIMIFENWKNIVTLWQAIEKYWKIMNMVVWFLPNRHQGFSAKRHFYSKYDIAQVAGKGKLNLEEEDEFREYLEGKGQKLLDNYEIVLYGQKGDSAWGKAKGTKFWMIGDHITWVASSESSTGQNVVFGTKPIQILIPYIKILSPRNGIIMEPFGGSGSTIIASEIMKRKCRAIEISPTYAEVIISRFERISGQEAKKLD